MKTESKKIWMSLGIVTIASVVIIAIAFRMFTMEIAPENTDIVTANYSFVYEKNPAINKN